LKTASFKIQMQLDEEEAAAQNRSVICVPQGASRPK